MHLFITDSYRVFDASTLIIPKQYEEPLRFTHGNSKAFNHLTKPFVNIYGNI